MESVCVWCVNSLSVNLLALDSEKHKLRYRTANTAAATKRNGPKRQMQHAAWLPQIWTETESGDTRVGVGAGAGAGAGVEGRKEHSMPSMLPVDIRLCLASLSLCRTISNCVCELHIKLLSNIKLTAALALPHWGALPHTSAHTPRLHSLLGLFVCCTKNETRNATRRRTSSWHYPGLCWLFFLAPLPLPLACCCCSYYSVCVCGNTRNFNAILNASISFCES